MRETVNRGPERGASQPPRRVQRGRSLRRTNADWFGFICLCLMVTCSILLAINLITLRMLPTKYLLAALLVLVILNALHAAVQLPIRYNKGGKILCGIVAILLSAAMLYGFSATTSVQNALKKIGAFNQETKTLDVVVLSGSSAQSLADVQGQTFGVLSTMESTTLQKMTDEMAKQIGTVSTTAVASPTQLAASLYDGKVKAVIVADAYLESLSEMEGYQDIAGKTRIIYQYDVTEAAESSAAQTVDITKEPFVVYLSGSDSRSDNINATGRSDVNILAVVNPKTHQILLLNTPRDYYVPLSVSGGVRDKLTHAGVYGIDCSEATLSMLYGAQIPYYVRINFTGFENIVNALGGVTVHSDYTFTAEGYQFVEGDNTLMGAAALTFVRERYAFSEGDNQRGKDQMAMIKAILNKAMSPAILTNYQSLLSAVAGSFTTNFSYDDMAAFVQQQLSTNASWNITSYAVSGTGDMATTYTYPDENLYVMWPDQAMVDRAKGLIQQVMNGEVPQV